MDNDVDNEISAENVTTFNHKPHTALTTASFFLLSPTQLSLVPLCRLHTHLSPN